ncbi:gluconokinase [Mucilaginibacter gotjawali]|uniref:Gluconokinase n=2 Tax=Mucilaginibacter gotjawali TaxID=1550579 RepID=A0A839SEZ1_9SPHI|nr:gluconokinase [Mucilaginibacter gotjawali]MBB3055842.1 gluconokinase [Mucilaginibacter gotjawali]BAU54664.1 Xylulose kinase [Mucilaginibacter gotjawali]
MEYVLGIDIGTGSVKAVAVDPDGKSFTERQQHYGFNSPNPGYHEQDPGDIWKAFKEVVGEIILKTGAQPLAVGLSSAMHSLIAVDEDCNALAPMITWADNRSSVIAQRLRATPEGMAIYTATGTPLHAMSPLCKLIWLRENNPDIYSKAQKFIGIKEFIWHKLFNEFVIDYSIASSTGLFDIVNFEWYPDALKMAGINDKLLSRPVPANYTEKYKVSLPDTGLFMPGTPVTIAASDGCCANLGSMADKPGVAAITIGTSGAVRVASNKPLPNEAAMTFSYILDDQTYICGGPINNGGIAIQWWLKNFSGPDLSTAEYEVAFEQIAAIPAGANGLIFLPYLTGERAPIWDSESCGVFFGVKLQHTKDHFSRAVLEGICFALKDVLDAVQQNSEPIIQVNISGGFVKSEVWVKLLADITWKNLAIVQSDDASAVGAAFIAMKACGLSQNYPAPLLSQMRFVKPDPENAAVYAKQFEIYRQLYHDLKPTMHQVHQ